jgi:hypothetical protein
MLPWVGRGLETAHLPLQDVQKINAFRINSELEQAKGRNRETWRKELYLQIGRKELPKEHTVSMDTHWQPVLR